MTVLQHVGMFMLGIRDSISVEWISKTLLYVDPQTKKVHPSSKMLFDSLKSSLIKILLYIIIVPKIFEYFDFLSISAFLKVVYLILTYGYLFFYNNDIMVCTFKLIAWQERRTPGSTFELDKAQKIQFFTQLSIQIKSFIFLLFYYVPIFLIQTKIMTFIPYLGMLCLIVSESFFNGVFYFLKTWPFDKYNIGFVEKEKSYMIGYGLVISVVCNYILQGSYATGAYLILSLWMLINSVIYSPPEIKFEKWEDVFKAFSNSNYRNSLKNLYNIHRQKIRKDVKYRQQITNKIFLVYPALKITQFLNKKSSKLLTKEANKVHDILQKVNEQDEQNEEGNPNID